LGSGSHTVRHQSDMGGAKHTILAGTHARMWPLNALWHYVACSGI
jgi:hypothetical protein